MVDALGTMFRSARLKLTFFYLATLLGFSITLTVGIRVFAEYELNRAFAVQRGEFREMARSGLSLLVPHPEQDFYEAQDSQAMVARRHLNQDLALLNIGALVVGGLISYWFAGRTLRPLAESHESQARFVADASHELRTPLANMRAENEVFLRSKSFTEAETRELVQSNLEEVQRLEDLSRDLLALAQYGQTELTRTVVAPDTIVEEALVQIKKILANSKVTVKQQLDHTNKAAVYGNQESLVRLLVILLDNAVKYGPRPGTIYVAGALHGSNYVLTVRDEGKGIAGKDLPYIFDRLYRGDPARANTTSGYGLGLALAKEIVQANHGSIKAYNHTEGGAVFSVQLPASKLNQAAAAA